MQGSQPKKDEDTYLNQVICGGTNLCQVPSQKMTQKLHKNNVAIISNSKNIIARGSGLLISKNLVLTCAHNFYNNSQRINNESFSIYVGQRGRLEKPYKIENVYIPEKFINQPDQNNPTFDYALLKLSQKVDSSDFIPLKGDFENKNTQIAIFGYPGTKYLNKDLQKNIEQVSQWGLKMKNIILSIRQQNSLIIHRLSTLGGQSGSAIIQLQNDNISIIGIHKGGIKAKVDNTEKRQQANVGKLLNHTLIDEFQMAVQMLGAQKFLRLPKNQDQNKLYKQLVTIQYKIDEKKFRFFGAVISKNLVITAAHCFFVNRAMVSKDSVSIHIQKNFQQLKTYKIENWFIPGLYSSNPVSSNVTNDYALIKVSQKFEANDFMKLQSADLIRQQNLKMFGFSQPIETVDTLSTPDFLAKKQIGMMQIKEMSQERNEISYDQSIRSKGGSPLLLSQYNQTCIVGIHKGIVKKNIYRQTFSANCGTLLTRKIIKQLQQQAHTMNAENFQIYKQQILLNRFLQRGKEDLKNQDYKNARICFENALQVDPKSQDGHLGLGMVYKMTYQTYQAILTFNKLLKLTKNNQKAHVELGILFSRINGWQMAIQSFSKALQVNKDNYVANTHLSNAYLQSNSQEKASQCVQNALKINQNYDEAYYVLGKLCYKSKKNAESRKNLEKCLQLNPKNWKAKLLLEEIKIKS